eukprot:8786526-Lingulodinium_polyedra.AAC.1
MLPVGGTALRGGVRRPTPGAGGGFRHGGGAWPFSVGRPVGRMEPPGCRGRHEADCAAFYDVLIS